MKLFQVGLAMNAVAVLLLVQAAVGADSAVQKTMDNASETTSDISKDVETRTDEVIDSTTSAATGAIEKSPTDAASDMRASGKTTTTTTTTETKMPMAKVTVISFEEGQIQLTPQQQQQLRSVVQNARSAGEIDEVHLAVWSDRPMPTQTQPDLPDTSKTLAQSRVDSIESFLKDQAKIDDVEAYSMAEKTNWLSRTFNTAEADLKKMFSSKSAETAPITNEEFKVIKERGGANKAVVLIEMENKATTSGSTTVAPDSHMGDHGLPADTSSGAPMDSTKPAQPAPGY